MAYKIKTLRAGWNYKKLDAFTLAEVLITIVIIGVIAAITVPILINKYNDQKLISQFKKSYSSLLNTINRTNMIDFGGQADCYYSDIESKNNQCSSFFQTLAKNMNVTKTCKGNAKADGCVPTYSTYGGCGGFAEDLINNTITVYLLSDGQIIIPYGYNMPLFVVDINGFKGPNKYGYDLFGFEIQEKAMSGLYLKSTNCYTRAPGGRSSEEMIKHAFVSKE